MMNDQHSQPGIDDDEEIKDEFNNDLDEESYDNEPNDEQEEVAPEDTDEEKPEEESPLEDKAKEHPHGDNLLKALHAEREEKRKAAEEAAYWRKQAETFNQRPQQQVAPENKPVAEPEPDYDLDPDEWMRWNINNLKEQIKQSSEPMQAEFKRLKQMEIERNAQDEFSAYEEEAKQQLPDYEDAKNALIEAEVRKLKAIGYKERDARNMINRDLLSFAGHAERNRQHPAQAIYEYAKNAGYYNPEASRPVIQKRNLNAARDIKQKSKGALSGQGKGGEITSIAGLTPEDLNANPQLWNKLTEKQIKKILRGGGDENNIIGV